MNTLKPLLTVAVLAGIGYGVYIRLNAGGNAPPPPVDPGWNNTPNIQLPEATSSAPWSMPLTAAVASAAPSATVTVPGGEAPAFAGPAAAGVSSAPPLNPMPPTAPGTPAPGGVPGSEPVQSPPAVEASLHGGAPPFDAHSAAPRAAMVPGDPYAAPTAAPVAPNDPYGAPSPSSPPAYDFNPAPAGPPAEYSYPPAGPQPQEGFAPTDGAFAHTMQSVRRELENGQLASALRQMTEWYGNPQLSPAEQQELSQLLDQVAGTVVYSTQNLLENPYEVQPGERLEAISEKYQVPWQLLAKINGIDDPASLQPGERLKVVRGPFKATVLLDRGELVLYTGDGLYAGRFRIGIGAEHPPQEGTYVVSDKSENPVYYGTHSAIGAEDPNNPLGERWIGLGKNMAIHGTNRPENIGRTDLPGCISLSETDVVEVYDILSLGSQVTIRR